MRTFEAMQMTPKKITWFTFFKLPAVYWSGIRVTEISESRCVAQVKFRWINQNPFKSMFWAVQGMAAELTTGALVMQAIQSKNQAVSMLLVATKAEFHKKARGRIRFICEEGRQVQDFVEAEIESGGGRSQWFKAVGIDEGNEIVSEFHFEWSIKSKP